MIAKIGENLIISQLHVYSNKNLNLNYYVHNPYKNNIGKIISIHENVIETIVENSILMEFQIFYLFLS